MQRMLLALVLALGVVPAATASAQQAIDPPRPWDSLTQREKERELQQQQWQGASGFWTSPHKSEHGAYRYRLLGIGAALVMITGLATWRLVRRASADRAARG